MDKTTGMVFATFGGSLYLVHGFLAVMVVAINGTNNFVSVGQYLNALGGSLADLIVGFLVLLGAILINSDSSTRRQIGGALAILFSTGGVYNAFILWGGISSTGFVPSATVIAQTLLPFETFAILAVGYPLVMAGAFLGLFEKETGVETSTT